MELSNEQQIVFNKYLDGANIFMTGPGGSGKSFLIRHIYEDAISKGLKIKVTAMTGCAAILLQCNASTIHSWAGIGIADKSVDYYVSSIRKNRRYREKWLKTDILIIDEVSMMSKQLFDKLNEIGKKIRMNDRPFGGIQLIFSGDFYQLPPIIKDENDGFCFESDEWNNVFTNQIELQVNYRQEDKIFVKILKNLRKGKIKKKHVELLKEYVGREVEDTLLVKPIKLYPINNKVNAVNKKELDKLETKEYEFEIEVNNNIKNIKVKKTDIDRETDYLKKNIFNNENLKLKIGAQVMCTYNLNVSIGICNGSLGIVTNILNDTPVVLFNNGVEMNMERKKYESENIEGLSISQYPLVLAYAISIHKSQGTTLDSAEIDIGNSIFECGQIYVALSRLKSLDGLYIKHFDPNKIYVNELVKNFYENI